MLFSLTGSVCIAAACLVQGDPRLGLLGCSAFAVLGGYIAFFHSARDMMINLSIAISTGAVLATRLIRYYDTVVAGCAFLLVLVLNVAFPFAVHWLVRALGSDLRHSSLNDTHGHSIGDQALVAVGGALRLACPPTSFPRENF